MWAVVNLYIKTMTVTILYRTDNWHSYASRDLIGVFTDKRKLKQAVTKIIQQDHKDNPKGFKSKESLKKYIKWNVDFFLEKGQTQGLCNGEIFSETVETNTII